MKSKIVLLIIAMFSSYSFASNYIMPVGIPDTNINFTQEAPDRPSNWTVEQAGYYYIKYDKGNDSLKYGTPDAPRKTIPQVLPQGSYVEISGNYSYASGGAIKIYGTGSNEPWVANQSGPVWVTTAQDEQANFTKSTVLVWGDNVYLTKLNVTENSKIQVGSLASGYPANNIVVKNSTVIGTLDMKNGELLSVKGAESSQSTNVVLYKNTISDAGDINSTTDIDAGLMASTGYTSNVWILENTGYNASGSGLQINPRPPVDASHNIYAGKNEFFNVRQSGLWVKYATNVVFSTNYVHDIISTAWSPAKGLGAQYEPKGLWIINNRIRDVEYGIRIASTSNIDNVSFKVYIVGNIIYDVHTESNIGTSSAWESAGIHIQGGDERFIYNNLTYNTPNGINISATSGTTKIKNNVIAKVDNGHKDNQQGYHIWTEHHDEQPSLTLSHNFFPSDELNIKFKSTVITTLFTLDDHLNNKVENKGVISKNYSGMFENTPLDIDSLISEGFNESILWDVGDDVFTELNTELAVATNSTIKLDKDILNNSRIEGYSVDIGPFEMDGTNPDINISSKPNNPSGVTIKVAP
ncbi:right-handed parallel beta-helix repeat-containing protein [Vibrio sp. 1-Bac 57]